MRKPIADSAWQVRHLALGFLRASGKYNRAWRRENRDRQLGYEATWAKRNPEATREKKRRWEIENRRQRNALKTGRQRIQRQAPIPPDLLEALMAEPCRYCGGESEQADHVVPLARGGEHRIENLAPACARCNQSKGAKLLSEWKGPPARA